MSYDPTGARLCRIRILTQSNCQKKCFSPVISENGDASSRLGGVGAEPELGRSAGSPLFRPERHGGGPRTSEPIEPSESRQYSECPAPDRRFLSDALRQRDFGRQALEAADEITRIERLERRFNVQVRCQRTEFQVRSRFLAGYSHRPRD